MEGEVDVIRDGEGVIDVHLDKTAAESGLRGAYGSGRGVDRMVGSSGNGIHVVAHGFCHALVQHLGWPCDTIE